MMLAALLDSFALLPEPLPDASVTGLVALAREMPVGHSARNRVVGRRDVPREVARSLVGPAPQRSHLATYLARRDVPAAEVVAELADATPPQVGAIARETRDPEVLAHLAGHPDQPVLIAVAVNPATPVPDATRAVAAAVEAPEEPQSAYLTRISGRSPYEWIRNRVPAAVVEAWARDTDHLDALLAAVSSRGLSPAPMRRAATLALALVPDDVTNLSQAPQAYAALQRLAAARPCDEVRRELVAELRARGLRVDRVDAARSLGLTKANEASTFHARSWRTVAKQAKDSTDAAGALLAVLSDIAGDDPDTWRTMIRLSDQHAGTVAALADTAVAITTPAATDDHPGQG